MKYEAPHWLPGGHLQTIWPALYARRAIGKLPQYRRDRWNAPDGDFVDVDWALTSGDPLSPPTTTQVGKRTDRPLLVLFHGLEGSSSSHYAHAFADFASHNAMSFAVPHFRGCSGEVNLAPRAYHSGDYAEIDWILRRFRTQHSGPIVVVGVSMGGNALMRWAQEMGAAAAEVVSAVAAVCSPIDLAASGQAIGQGFNRLVYTRMFLQTMKPKAHAKLAQHPGLFDRDAMARAKDLYEFDNVYTAPVHGYKNTDDYWTRASAKPHLHTIKIPALVVNALNDPFVPANSLPEHREVGSHVTLWQPAQGGHVGFPQGRFPAHLQALPDQVGNWLRQHYAPSAATANG